MMFGIPTIVADSPGLDEMFIEGYNTIRKIKISTKQVSMKQESMLFQDALQENIQKPSFLKKISHNARETYEGKYSINIFRNNYINLFEKYCFSG